MGDPFSEGEQIEGEALERQLDQEPYVVSRKNLAFRALVEELQKQEDIKQTEF